MLVLLLHYNKERIMDHMKLRILDFIWVHFYEFCDI